MSGPRLSVLLPTWNGEAQLARLLPVLARQEVQGGFEIRAVDSGSTDRTRGLLEEAGAIVTRIERSEFRHGRTRNDLAREARGELFVFLSQDALPAGERFLASLAAAFDDPRVAGAYARVLPHPGDDPLTARTVLDLPEAGEIPETRDLDGRGPLSSLDPRERARLCAFNDVASCIRRSVLERIPFPDVAFGEDSAWAARALEAGFRIRFAPEAVVLHSHRYTMRGAFERYRIDAAFQREVHGWRVRPTLLSAARGFAHELRQDLRHVARNGGAVHLLRSPFLRAAQVLGQHAGSREPWPYRAGVASGRSGR